MSLIPWLVLILIVVLATVGQLSLKFAFQAPVAGTTPQSIRELLYSRYFWLWLLCYVVVTCLWLLVLRSLPLSQAFPALGLTFALVPLASHQLLKEQVVLSQWLGIVIIVAGVILVVHK